MTLHYEAIKMYHRGEDITVDAVTLKAYQEGDRDTISHLIEGEWLELKPPIRGYGHYVVQLNYGQLHEFFVEAFGERN